MIKVDMSMLDELGVPYEDSGLEVLFQGPAMLEYTLWRDKNDPRSRCLYYGDHGEFSGDAEVDSSKSGSNHSQWEGGRIFRNGQAYLKTYEKHPRRDARGYVMEKIIAMELELKRRMWSFERVYHRDRNKPLDNGPSNIGLMYLFEGDRRRWYVDSQGNYLRWGSPTPFITDQDGRVREVSLEFSREPRTKATAPKKPWRLYDRYYLKDEGINRLWLHVGATCHVCGKPKWQNVSANGNILDYDRMCHECTQEKNRKWHPLPKTDYWLEHGRECVITYRRSGHDCFFADMRKDWIDKDLAPRLLEMVEVQFWSIPVDNSTAECIVKEA